MSDTTNNAQASSEAAQGTPGRIAVRYRDAYAVAHSLTSFGTLLKICAVILLALAVLAGSILAERLGQAMIPEMGRNAFFAGTAAGAILFLPVYVAGMLFGALGQILKASVDTAVNTSPLLTEQDKSKIMLIKY